MKHYYLLLFALLSFSLTQAQIVDIPDANFKNALLNHFIQIDHNNDGEIQVSEAEWVTYLDVSNSNITDMTGLEAFVNLTNLYCFSNQIGVIDLSSNTLIRELNVINTGLTNLNVSGLTQLRSLYCSSNDLSSLDVTNNLMLENLSCRSNNLNNIDLSMNTSLITLHIDNNPISEIDLSNNSQLEIFGCENTLISDINFFNNTFLFDINLIGTQISNVDLTNNPELVMFDASSTSIENIDFSNNPKLSLLVLNDMDQLSCFNVQNNDNENFGHQDSVYESNSGIHLHYNRYFSALRCNELDFILVDDVQIANDTFTRIPDYTVFSSVESGCNSLDIEESIFDDSVTIYPNPAKDFINLKSKTNLESIRIFDVHGRQIFTQLISTKHARIDVSNFAKGIYFLNVKTFEGEQTTKFIKK